MEFELKSGESASVIQAIKGTVAAELAVPPRFQQLVLGASHATEETLEKVVVGDTLVVLNMIFNVDDACRDIMVGSQSERTEILTDLGILGSSGDSCFTVGLVAQHASERVNLTKAAQGVDVLGKLAERGEHHAMSALYACLADKNSAVRAAAVNVLGELAHRGSQEATIAVSALLEDLDCFVREAAVDALRKIVQHGDQRAITAVCARLQHRSFDVRKAALGILGDIAHQGDQRALMAISAHLEDHDHDVRTAASVRMAAVDALGKIAEKGDQHALIAVSARLGDRDHAVRKAAVTALGKIAQRGNQQAIAAVSARLNDENKIVRYAAMDVLGKIRVPRPTVAADFPCNGKHYEEKLMETSLRSQPSHFLVALTKLARRVCW